MEWIETTGSSINEAVDNALEALGIKRQELEYEIIEEGKKGIFGIGGASTRIRARVKPLSREKPRDKKQRAQRKVSSKDKKQSPRERKQHKKVESKMSEADIPQESSQEEKREYAAPLETQAQYAKDFLAGLVRYFDDSSSISYEFEEEAINVSVDGNQVGLLIGSRGSTLFAIEELMRAVVQAKVGGFTARMYLDVGGYRAKRKEALAEFAESLAVKVKETGRTQVLEPMVASDRKIIHDVIAAINGVTTTSEGYDPKRRVVVMIGDSSEE